MDISSNRSQDEDKVMQRQLYRAGQSQPAAKAPVSAPARSTAPKAPPPPAKGVVSAKPSGKSAGGGERILLMIVLLGVGYYLIYGTPSQRRKTSIGLGVAAWLLLLGAISYCIFLPNLAAIQHQRSAIFADDSLTMKEKFEKVREMESGLSSSQRRDLRKLDMKERIRKNNKDIYSFLQLTPEEQMAQLKRETEERKKMFEKMRKEWGSRPKNRNNNNKGNNNNNNNNNRGGPPGGFAGGGSNREVSMLESGSSPEARAGNVYKRGMAEKAGLNSGFGGRGGPGGGGGGRGGGGR